MKIEYVLFASFSGCRPERKDEKTLSGCMPERKDDRTLSGCMPERKDDRTLSGYKPETTAGTPLAMEIESGATVRMLMKRLSLPEDRPKIIFVNGLKTTEDAVLKEGDRAGIFPLVAGG